MKAWIEIERPGGWTGGPFSESADSDWIEVEIEGSGGPWTDDNYGADADGNRGIRISGFDAELIGFTIEAIVKPRNPFVRFWNLLRRVTYAPQTVHLSENDFTKAEIEAAGKALEDQFCDGEEFGPDPDDYWDDIKEDR